MPSSFSKNPSMSPEIILNITDIVSASEDIVTLRSISQSCRKLFYYCRPTLFKSIELNGYRVSEKQISALYELLTMKGNEKLALHVHRFVYLPYEDDAENEKLISIINRLSKVKEFNLNFKLSYYRPHEETKNWEMLPNTLKNTLRGVLSLDSLEKLDISYITEFPVSELCRSRNLKYLNIACCHFIPSILDDSQSLPHLRTLCANDDCGYSVSALLGKDYTGLDGVRDTSRVVDFTGLESLTIYIVDGEDWPDVHDLIEFSRNKLNHLRIGVLPPNTLDGLAKSITDAETGMPNLKSLEFDISVRNAIQDLFLGLCEELSQLEGTSAKHALESINIDIHVCKDRDCSVDADKWGLLAKILLRPGFGTCRMRLRVVIEFLEVDEEERGLERNLLQLKEEIFGEILEKKGLNFHYSVEAVYIG